MSKIDKKPIIGILGGIGAGKTTVADEFKKLGCKVINADEIAHRLLDSAAIRKRLVNLFGEAILGAAGEINRKKLAEIAFEDREKVKSLNRILHPPVLAKTRKLIAEYSRRPRVRAIVLDMPLLAEVGWLDMCDKVIFIKCKKALRLKRAPKKGIFNETQLKKRENFQISLDKKAKVADNIIDNNSALSALTKKVTAIFSGIINQSK